jgi:hypothetical protein
MFFALLRQLHDGRLALSRGRTGYQVGLPLLALCSKTQPTNRQAEKGLGAFAETLYERVDQGSSTCVWIQLAHRRHFEGFGRKPPEFFSSLPGGK